MGPGEAPGLAKFGMLPSSERASPSPEPLRETADIAKGREDSRDGLRLRS